MVTPTGTISLPLHYLRLTIAESSSFQSWTGAADKVEALDYIHVVAAEDSADFDSPLAVVDWADNLDWMHDADGARNQFEQSGDLMALFRAPVAAVDTAADAAFNFLNPIGDVIADILQIAGNPGFLDITRAMLAAGPSRPTEDEAETSGDFYQAVFGFEFQSEAP